MKYALLVLSAFSTAALAAVELPGRQQCKIKVDSAKDTVRILEDRFNAGEVTRTDFNGAKIALVEMQVSCYEIVRGNLKTAGSYCSKENADLRKEYVNGILEEARIGQRTPEELRLVRKESALMEAKCVE